MTPRIADRTPSEAATATIRPHTLIGLDAGGHICSACGRVTDFLAHIATIAITALAA